MCERGTRLAACAIAGLLSLLTCETLAQDADCQAHGFKPEDVKQRLRRWRGLAAFNRWRLAQVAPAACIQDGTVDVVLTMAPPASWSRRGLPYRIQTTIQLDGASGAPQDAPVKAYRQLAGSVKRIVRSAEASETVLRFIERYPPRQVEIRAGATPDRLWVDFRAAPSKDGPAGRAPALTYSGARPQGVSAYQVPAIDGLPARRELLRFVETFSQHHAQCRPRWVSVRWKDLPPPPPTGPPGNGKADRIYGKWEMDFELGGNGCPPAFRGTVSLDRSVVEVLPARPTDAE